VEWHRLVLPRVPPAAVRARKWRENSGVIEADTTRTCGWGAEEAREGFQRVLAYSTRDASTGGVRPSDDRVSYLGALIREEWGDGSLGLTEAFTRE